jgi:hypothetical protein
MPASLLQEYAELRRSPDLSPLTYRFRGRLARSAGFDASSWSTTTASRNDLLTTSLDELGSTWNHSPTTHAGRPGAVAGAAAQVAAAELPSCPVVVGVEVLVELVHDGLGAGNRFGAASSAGAAWPATLRQLVNDGSGESWPHCGICTG